ncbi:tyrosinase family oxidase copper chaperone [Streptomyces sp. NPDC000983]|uniref:tyrosinase family oxidase copper chaperone n=1 Tax=Streptomyces sp. NPDC000983 TaxID=3154373 RepID=UPI00332237BD
MTGVGGVTTGAERAARNRARPGRGGGGRRDVLRRLLAAAGVLATAPVIAASRPPSPGHPGRGRAEPAGTAFDETYRGRRLCGTRISAGGACGPEQWYVTVDGTRLHLMRRADGTWLNMVDHYCSYAAPLDAARAAVDELGPGEQLRDPRTGTGGHHGVRA